VKTRKQIMGCGASTAPQVQEATTEQVVRDNGDTEVDTEDEQVPKERIWDPALAHDFGIAYCDGLKKGSDVVVARAVFRTFSHELDKNFMKRPQLYEMLTALGMPPGDNDTDEVIREFDRDGNGKCEVHEFIREMQTRSRQDMEIRPCNFQDPTRQRLLEAESEDVDGSQWTEGLARSFLEHYKSNFNKKRCCYNKGGKSCKVAEKVFRLFSGGSKEMSMPQLYNFLTKIGTPPDDVNKITVFREFDRNLNEHIECPEFVRGMYKRSMAEVPCEPCEFGESAQEVPESLAMQIFTKYGGMKVEEEKEEDQHDKQKGKHKKHHHKKNQH